jgi:ABC-type glycerol-3-phosphate transport system permease component
MKPVGGSKEIPMNSTQAQLHSSPEMARIRRRKAVRQAFQSLFSHTLLLVVAALFIIPFLWLIITSLKQEGQVFTDPLTWIPNPIMWSNYPDALFTPAFNFLPLLKNTLFYVITTTIGTVASSTIVAYGLARLRFPGRNFLFIVTLATMMMPGIVTLIPTYVMFKWLGWVGTYAPLIIPAFFGSAFNIFLLRQFMMTIPWDLTDAALVDGANDFVILWKIIVPLIKPALLVIAVFNIMWTWNDFFGPLIYLSDSKQYPLVMGLYAFRTRTSIKWSLMMAATLATCFPLVVLFFVAQRYFIEGITLTGLKGV